MKPRAWLMFVAFLTVAGLVLFFGLKRYVDLAQPSALVSAGGNSSVSLSNVHAYPDTDVYGGKIYECVDQDGEIFDRINRPDLAMKMGMRCYEMQHRNDAAMGIRGAAMQVNIELARILPDPLLINVGSAPNDGTGDSIPIAMGKIRDDLRRIPEVPAVKSNSQF